VSAPGRDSIAGGSGPVVSIVTPTFRHQHFIERCIRSVLAQSYPSWELIVIDDASPDATAQIVERFVGQDSRIRLIRHQTNYGAGRLSETYNEALAHCSGELIAILEGDDEWAPGKLAEQVPVFDDKRVVLCYSDYDEVTTEGLLIARHGASAAAAPARSGIKENLRFFSGLKSFGANTVIVRHGDLLGIGGFVDAGLHLVDYPTWLRLALRGDFVRIPSVLGSWRRHPDSVYWATQYTTLGMLEGHFLNFLGRERAHLLAVGFTDSELESLSLNPARALEEKQRSRQYFEGKYQLLMGQRLKAILPLSRALIGPGTSLRHRFGALAGMVAAATSPRLMLSLNRMVQDSRPARSE
jgi:glycosyltransferase involved in cell wall biosynthesis